MEVVLRWKRCSVAPPGTLNATKSVAAHLAAEMIVLSVLGEFTASRFTALN